MDITRQVLDANAASQAMQASATEWFRVSNQQAESRAPHLAQVAALHRTQADELRRMMPMPLMVRRTRR